MKRIWLSTFLAFVLLSGCVKTPVEEEPQDLSVDELRELLKETHARNFLSEVSVAYNIFPIAFADSTGNNHGDLRGIINKLDYLNDGDPNTTTDLGITAIWLNPIHPSNTYHKYDVLDYYQIDPKFGTLDDFKELVEKANERGIKIIMDMVFNHSAFNHPWFTQALRGNEPYNEYYRIEKTLPTELYPNRTGWHQTSGIYYYGGFWDRMPEFNLDSPKVREEFKNIISFWLEMGVTGIRYDAVKHGYDRREWPEGTPTLQKNLQFWMTLQLHAKTINPDAFVVAEMWDSNLAMQPYAQAYDSLFNFDFGDMVVNALNSGVASNFMTTQIRNLEGLRSRNPNYVDAPFLKNHDQPRIFNELGFDLNKMRLASVFLLTQEGIPFIYYGEELGMRGIKPDERIREPMRWNNTIGSEVAYWTQWQYNWDTPTVEEQDQDPNSLLNHYRRLINLRHNTPALRFGNTEVFSVFNSSIVAYTRQYEGETIVILVNLYNGELEGQDRDGILKDLEILSSYESYKMFDDNTFTLGPRGYVIGRLKP
jgi:alpha-amylase